MINSWVHKGVEDAVNKYYIKLEEPQDRRIHHDFVKVGNLVIDALKNCMISNWVFQSVHFWNISSMQVINIS